ncbi:hypothetical protein NKR23_g11573 [Pleurostoma richardsiae]|uniref:Uncharacterized protein n=1 Tax=Pleurostoma richardsiae TaxID=41990 RepID=A0AA38RH16_9PEZI|nr:hypothetical protein NKR23_g11573 [Pleurostoma richardsiae]
MPPFLAHLSSAAAASRANPNYAHTHATTSSSRGNNTATTPTNAQRTPIRRSARHASLSSPAAASLTAAAAAAAAINFSTSATTTNSKSNGTTVAAKASASPQAAMTSHNNSTSNDAGCISKGADDDSTVITAGNHNNNRSANSSGVGTPSPLAARNSQHRVSKAARKVFARIGSMEPPVQSFYGVEPIPLPSRFANIKRRLIQGHEAAVEASWRRLLSALKGELAQIHRLGADLIPVIDFADIDDRAKVTPFERGLKRYGVAVVRGVVSPDAASRWVNQTRDYLARNRESLKPPPPQDPTCFDLFWTPAQIAVRAHPSMLRVQKWAMSFWESKGADADLSRIATRCPISYADRLRIHDSTILGATAAAANPANGNSAADSTSIATGSTLLAQVDSGSLERWEPDGYGRGGAYEAIFHGRWEDFDPWDPSGRVAVTPDLYNGAGACSIFRMFQGVLALTSGEPASIRVLPSPKLVIAYLLLRPFFSPKSKAPAHEEEDDDVDLANPKLASEWDAFLHPDNWALDAEQTTIIHGAVPGHAQRITELWHPHLRLRKSLVEIPTLRAGDYVLWHCDEAYSIVTAGASKPGTPAIDSPPAPAAPSILMYTGSCPLTQTNALFLARQRKAFMLGQPGPDFDSIGSGMGAEAPREDGAALREIAEVGGDDGLRAMGLVPWELDAAKADPEQQEDHDHDKMAIDWEASDGNKTALSSLSEGEVEVVRLANIILFPDRYDFYIPTEPRIDFTKAKTEQNNVTSQLIARVLS